MNMNKITKKSFIEALIEWRYLRILDNLNTSEFLEAIRDKSGTLQDKVKRLEDKYLLVKEF